MRPKNATYFMLLGTGFEINWTNKIGAIFPLSRNNGHSAHFSRSVGPLLPHSFHSKLFGKKIME